ncbi:MAG: hypothetical protein FWB98_02945 [Defluviitaleaceae bacterium]|nr:hypothetical protein [Defluviitaleaceae bacterium]
MKIRNFLAGALCILLILSAVGVVADTSGGISFFASPQPDGSVVVTIQNASLNAGGNWRLAIVGDEANWLVNGVRANFTGHNRDYYQMGHSLSPGQSYTAIIRAEGLQPGWHNGVLTLWTTQGANMHPFNGTVLGTVSVSVEVKGQEPEVDLPYEPKPPHDPKDPKEPKPEPPYKPEPEPPYEPEEPYEPHEPEPPYEPEPEPPYEPQQPEEPELPIIPDNPVVQIPPTWQPEPEPDNADDGYNSEEDESWAYESYTPTPPQPSPPQQAVVVPTEPPLPRVAPPAPVIFGSSPSPSLSPVASDLMGEDEPEEEYELEPEPDKAMEIREPEGDEELELDRDLDDYTEQEPSQPIQSPPAPQAVAPTQNPQTQDSVPNLWLLALTGIFAAVSAALTFRKRRQL